MTDLTIQTAAAYLMTHATPAFAPLLIEPVPGEPGLSRTVRVAIEVDDGIMARALTYGGTAAWRDVLTERGKQIHDKGYTPEHDDAHASGEILFGAISNALIVSAGYYHPDNYGQSVIKTALKYWPWDVGEPDLAKPPRAHLVQAVAMLVAEIERIDRAAAEARP